MTLKWFKCILIYFFTVITKVIKTVSNGEQMSCCPFLLENSRMFYHIRPVYLLSDCQNKADYVCSYNYSHKCWLVRFDNLSKHNSQLACIFMDLKLKFYSVVTISIHEPHHSNWKVLRWSSWKYATSILGKWNSKNNTVLLNENHLLQRNNNKFHEIKFYALQFEEDNSRKLIRDCFFSIWLVLEAMNTCFNR